MLLWQTVNGDLAAAAVVAALAGDVVQPEGAVECGVLRGAKVCQYEDSGRGERPIGGPIGGAGGDDGIGKGDEVLFIHGIRSFLGWSLGISEFPSHAGRLALSRIRYCQRNWGSER